MPWVNINFDDAKKIASTIEDNEAVMSHLTFGSEYDSVLEWLIKTEAKTFSEIAIDSKKWGNYIDTKNFPKKIVKTGSRKEWYANNICDLAGNIREWTQELYGFECYLYESKQEQNQCLERVIRGGYYFDSGYSCPVAYRQYEFSTCEPGATGFRAALCIK